MQPKAEQRQQQEQVLLLLAKVAYHCREPELHYWQDPLLWRHQLAQLLAVGLWKAEQAKQLCQQLRLGLVLQC